MGNRRYLDTASLWFTIVGTVVSAVLAGLSIYLTFKISKQQVEIKDLGKVISELKYQNDGINQEIKEVSKQTKLLQENSVLFSKQLAILENDKKIEKSIELRNIANLWIEFDELGIRLEEMDSATFVNAIPEEEQLKILSRLYTFVERGINNPYIISHEKIYSYWYIFLEQIKSTQREFTDHSHEYHENGRRVTRSEFLMSDYSRFKKYLYTFRKKGIEPLINTKDFLKDRKLHIIESNFGRPIK